MRLPVSIIALLTASALAVPAFASPSGGEVIRGEADIKQAGTKTTIEQLTNRAIINWNSFDVGVGELVQFSQPGAESIAVNRIIGGDPTSILGQLQANGRIFILNPSGVVFGASAQVDVGGLLATTFDIDDDAFMSSDKLSFLDTGEGGYVINRGDIRVGERGFAFLVAPGVENDGLIVANLGTVVLGSGKEFTLDFQGDGLVSYQVSGEVLDEIVGPDGEALDSAVSNKGTINATGGTVLLTGNVANTVVSSIVNNEGVIEAQSLTTSGGKVSLRGGDSGIVQSSGTIDVSAAEDEDTAGGEVEISGEFAGNFGTIDASGDGAGSGGRVEIQSTRHTIAGSDSTIDVSGGDSGHGGEVLVYSDNRATMAGTIAARGGDGAGDGGFVEVSSPGQVELTGTVDASAPAGHAGEFLIDPKNIEVATTGGDAYDAGTNNEFSNNDAGDTVITPASINGQAATVTLQANTDITITDAITMTETGAGLTLQAGRSVLIDADVSTTNGAVSITANDPAATSAQRDAGAGSIAMAAGITLDVGTEAVTMTVSPDGHGDAGGITVAAIEAQSVELNSVGAVTQTGAIVAAGALSVTTLNDAGAAITLDHADNDAASIELRALNGAGDAAAAGAIQYTGTGGISVTGIETTSSVTLEAGGAVTQTGAILGGALSVATLDNAGAAITLEHADNDVASIDLRARNAANDADAAGDISYSDGGTNPLDIVALRTAGNASVDNPGAITMSGADSLVADELVLAATDTGSIGTDTDPILLKVNLVKATTTAGDVYLKSPAQGLTVGEVVAAGTSTLSLTAHGAITPSPGDVLTADTLELEVTAAGVAIGTSDTPLPIQADSRFDAKTVNGNLFITSAQNLPVGIVDVGTATASLISDATITQVTDGSVRGDVVSLGGPDGIGTAADPVRVHAGTRLDASSSDAAIYIRSPDDPLPVGDVNAVTGLVSLSSEGHMTRVGGGLVTAGDLTLAVTGADQRIGDEGAPLHFDATGTLNATTHSGSIILLSPSEDVNLGTLDAGTGVGFDDKQAVNLTVQSGSLYDDTGTGDENIIAQVAVLDVAGEIGNDDGIGKPGAPIRTNIGVLEANIRTDGGIYVADSGTLVVLEANARETVTAGGVTTEGLKPQPDSTDGSTVILQARSSNDPPEFTEVVGTRNIVISTVDDMLIGNLRAPNKVELTAGGHLLGLVVDGNHILAREAVLDAGANIGDRNPDDLTIPDEFDADSVVGEDLERSELEEALAAFPPSSQVATIDDEIASVLPGPLNLRVEKFSAKTAGVIENAGTDDEVHYGGIHIRMAAGGRAESVIAGSGAAGAKVDIALTNLTGTLTLVKLEAQQGFVEVNNEGQKAISVDTPTGDPTILGEGAIISSRASIGSSANPLRTDVSNIEARVDPLSSPTTTRIFIDNVSVLESITATTFGGRVRITHATETFEFNNPDFLRRLDSSGGQTAVRFNNEGGHIEVGAVDAGTSGVYLIADGYIRVHESATAGVNITASDLILRTGAGSGNLSIGTAADPLITDVADTLSARTSNGSIHIDNSAGTGPLDLELEAKGTDRAIEFETGGDILLDKVSATGDVKLVAGGAIKAVIDQTLTGSERDIALNRIRVSGKDAILHAGGVLQGDDGGTSVPLRTTVTSIDAKADGGLNIWNTKALDSFGIDGPVNGDIKLRTRGDVTIGTLDAGAGNKVVVNITGDLIDGNGAALNITADEADLTARKIGAAGTDQAIDTDIDDLTAKTNGGGIFINNTGDLDLHSIEATGGAAPIHVVTTGSIRYQSVITRGSIVTLKADETTGSITELAAGAEIIAKVVELVAATIGAEGTPLNLEVDELTFSGDAFVASSKSIGLTKAALEDGGGEIVAPSITILDMGGTTANVTSSLTLKATDGHVVFVNQDDTIKVSGNITVLAESAGAVAIIGNLTSTTDGNITIRADLHITIGTLNAGTGKVTVISHNGLILNGNGSAENIIAGSAELQATTPSAFALQQHSDHAGDIWSIAVAVAISRQDDVNNWTPQADASQAHLDAVAATLNETITDANQAQQLADTLGAVAIALNAAATTADLLSASLGLAAAIGETAAAAAEAVPLTGDGGTLAAVKGALGITAAVAGVVGVALGIAADVAAEFATNAAIDAAEASANVFAAQLAHDAALSRFNANEETLAIAEAALAAAIISRAQAEAVKAQAETAVLTTLAFPDNEPVQNLYYAIGTPNDPLVVNLSGGQLDVAVARGNIHIKSLGAIKLGDISAEIDNIHDDSNFILESADTVTVGSDISVDDLIRIDSDTSILDGDGTLSASRVVLTAANAVGSFGSQIELEASRFAAESGTGGVHVTNTGSLEIDTVDGVTGITSDGGGVRVTASGNLTLTQPIDASAGGNQRVTLTSDAGSIISGEGDDTNIFADDLGITANGDVGSETNPLRSKGLSNFEADIEGGSLYLVNDSAALTIGGVDGTMYSGVDINNVGTIDIDTTGSMTVDESITTNDGGTVNLTTSGTLALTDTAIDSGPTGEVDLTVGEGDIVWDAGTVNVITGTLKLAAQDANAAIGTADDPLLVKVDSLYASTGTEGSSGGLIHINDTDGGLNLYRTNTHAGGPVTIRAASPLTVHEDVTAADAIILEAEADSALGDDLTIKTGVLVRSSASTVDLLAGDDLLIEAGAEVDAHTALTISAGNDITLQDAVKLASQTDAIGLTATTGQIGIGDQVVITASEGVTFSAATSILVGEFAQFTSQNAAIGLTATAGNIEFGTGADVTAENALGLTAGADIVIGSDPDPEESRVADSTFTSESGSMTFLADDNVFIGSGYTASAGIDLSYTTDSVNIEFGTDAMVTATNNLNLDAGANIVIGDMPDEDAGFTATNGTMTFLAGTDISIGEQGDFGSWDAMSFEAGQNILIGNNFFAQTENAGANLSYTATAGNIGIGTDARVVARNDLTLTADENITVATMPGDSDIETADVGFVAQDGLLKFDAGETITLHDHFDADAHQTLTLLAAVDIDIKDLARFESGDAMVFEAGQNILIGEDYFALAGTNLDYTATNANIEIGTGAEVTAENNLELDAGTDIVIGSDPIEVDDPRIADATFTSENGSMMFLADDNVFIGSGYTAIAGDNLSYTTDTVNIEFGTDARVVARNDLTLTAGNDITVATMPGDSDIETADVGFVAQDGLLKFDAQAGTITLHDHFDADANQTLTLLAAVDIDIKDLARFESGDAMVFEAGQNILIGEDYFALAGTNLDYTATNANIEIGTGAEVTADNNLNLDAGTDIVIGSDPIAVDDPRIADAVFTAVNGLMAFTAGNNITIGDDFTATANQSLGYTAEDGNIDIGLRADVESEASTLTLSAQSLVAEANIDIDHDAEFSSAEAMTFTAADDITLGKNFFAQTENAGANLSYTATDGNIDIDTDARVVARNDLTLTAGENITVATMPGDSDIETADVGFVAQDGLLKFDAQAGTITLHDHFDADANQTLTLLAAVDIDIKDLARFESGDAMVFEAGQNILIGEDYFALAGTNLDYTATNANIEIGTGAEVTADNNLNLDAGTDIVIGSDSDPRIADAVFTAVNGLMAFTAGKNITIGDDFTATANQSLGYTAEDGNIDIGLRADVESEASTLTLSAQSLVAEANIDIDHDAEFSSAEAMTFTAADDITLGNNFFAQTENAGANLSYTATAGNIGIGTDARVVARNDLTLTADNDITVATMPGDSDIETPDVGFVAQDGLLKFDAQAGTITLHDHFDANANQTLTLLAAVDIDIRNLARFESGDAMVFTAGQNILIGEDYFALAGTNLDYTATNANIEIGTGAEVTADNNLELDAGTDIVIGSDSDPRIADAVFTAVNGLMAFTAGKNITIGDDFTATANQSLGYTAEDGNIDIGLRADVESEASTLTLSAASLGAEANILIDHDAEFSSAEAMTFTAADDITLGNNFFAQTENAGANLSYTATAGNIGIGTDARVVARNDLTLTADNNITVATMPGDPDDATVEVGFVAQDGLLQFEAQNGTITLHDHFDANANQTLTLLAAVDIDIRNLARFESGDAMVFTAGENILIGDDFFALTKNADANLTYTAEDGNIDIGLRADVESDASTLTLSAQSLGAEANILIDDDAQFSSAEAMTFTAADDITLGNNFFAQTENVGANLSYTATDGDITIGEQAEVTARNNLNLTAGTDIVIGNEGTFTATDLNMVFFADENITIGDDYTASAGNDLDYEADTGNITIGERASVTAQKNLDQTAGTDIVIGNVGTFTATDENMTFVATDNVLIGNDYTASAGDNLSYTATDFNIEIGNNATVTAQNNLNLDAGTDIVIGNVGTFTATAVDMTFLAGNDIRIGNEYTAVAGTNLAYTATANDIVIGDDATVTAAAQMDLTAGSDISIAERGTFESTAGNTNFVATDNVLIGNDYTASAGDNLSYTATDANIVFGNNATVTAQNNLNLTAGTDIVIGNVGTFTATDLNMVFFADDNITIGDDYTATAGNDLDYEADTGNITIGERATVTAENNLDLTAGTDIVIGNVGTFTASTLDMTFLAGNDIRIANEYTAVAGTNLGYTATANDIVIGDDATVTAAAQMDLTAGSDISIGERGTFESTAGNTNFVAADNVLIGNDYTASAGDNLSYTATNANIEFGNNATVTAQNNLNLTAGTDIVIGNVGTFTASTVDMGFVAGNDIRIANEYTAVAGTNLGYTATANDIVIGDDATVTAAAQMDLTAGSDISIGERGTFESTAGNTNFVAADNVLIGNDYTASAGDNLSYTATDANIVFGNNATVTAQNNLNLTAGTDIVIGNVGTFTASTLDMTFLAGNDIRIANEYTAVAGTNLGYTATANDIVIGDDATVTAGTQMDLTAGSDISIGERGTFESTAGNTNFVAADNVLIGNDYTASAGDNLSYTATNAIIEFGNNATVTAQNNLNLTAGTDIVIGNVGTFTASTVDMGFVAGNDIRIGNEYTAVAGTNLDYTATANDIVIGDDATVTAGAQMDLTAGSDISIAERGTFESTAGNTNFVAADNVLIGNDYTASAGDNLSYTATNANIEFGTGAEVTATNNLDLTAGTDIVIGSDPDPETQDPRIADAVFTAVNGLMAFTAGNNITIGDDFTGTAKQSLGYTAEDGSIDIGQRAMVESEASTLTLSAVRDQADSANILIDHDAQFSSAVAMTFTAADDITLGNNFFALTENEDANLTYTATAGDIAIGTDARVVARNDLTLMAGENITVAAMPGDPDDATVEVGFVAQDGSLKLDAQAGTITLHDHFDADANQTLTLLAAMDIDIKDLARFESGDSMVFDAGQNILIGNDAAVTAGAQMDLTAGSDILIGDDLTAAAGGALQYSATGASITLGNGATLDSASQQLTAADEIHVGNGFTATSGSTITYAADDGRILIGNDAEIGAQGVLAMSAGTNVQIGHRAALTSGSNIGLTAANNISTGNDLDATAASSLALTATGGSVGIGHRAVVAAQGSITATAGSHITIGREAAFTAATGTLALTADGNIVLIGNEAPASSTFEATTGSIALAAGNDLTIGNRVYLIAGSVMALEAANDANFGAGSDIRVPGELAITTGGDIALATGATLESTNDAVLLTAGGMIGAAAGSNVIAADGLALEAGGALVLDGGLAGDGVDLSAADMLQSGTISSSGAVNIHVTSADGSEIGGILLGSISAPGQVVTLTADGSESAMIANNIGGSGTNVVAERLVMNANGGIGTDAQRIRTIITRLDAEVTSDGAGIYLVDLADGLRLGKVWTNKSPGTVVDLTAIEGSILIAETVDPANIIAETINLQVTGDGSSIGNSAVFIDADFLNASTTGGNIFIVDVGGMELGTVTTTGATGSSVEIIVTGGSLTNGLGANDTNIISDSVQLTVTSGESAIGTSGAPLNTEINTLNAATDGGDIHVVNLTGNLSIGTVTTTGATGSVASISAPQGNITQSPDPLEEGQSNVTAGTIQLSANGLIGTSSAPLETSAPNVGLSSTTGSAYFKDDTDEVEILGTAVPPQFALVTSARFPNGRIITGVQVNRIYQSQVQLVPLHNARTHKGLSEHDGPVTRPLIELLIDLGVDEEEEEEELVDDSGITI